MIRHLVFSAIVVLTVAIVGSAKPPQAPKRTVTLNPASLDYARKLIADGHVVNDKHGDWSTHKPSAEDQNQVIRRQGSELYAQWYLGVDESHAADTKARYKFPFGDFKDVHRCALIAAQSRARQYGYADIDNAAAELLKLIEGRGQ